MYKNKEIYIGPTLHYFHNTDHLDTNVLFYNFNVMSKINVKSKTIVAYNVIVLYTVTVNI